MWHTEEPALKDGEKTDRDSLTGQERSFKDNPDSERNTLCFFCISSDFCMIGTDIRVENCKELLGQQTLTTNSVRMLSLDI